MGGVRERGDEDELNKFQGGLKYCGTELDLGVSGDVGREAERERERQEVPVRDDENGWMDGLRMGLVLVKI